MKVRRGERRRLFAAAVAGLAVAGAAWAQVNTIPVPPPSSVPVVPSAAPVPVVVPAVPEPPAEPVVVTGLPPLVVTPPEPPKPKPVVQPVPTEAVKVPAVPAVRVTPIVPTEVEVVPVPAIVEPAVPKFDVPAVVVPQPAMVTPVTPVTPVAVKPTKPAMSEIVIAGPKPVDMSAAFSTALQDAKTAMGKVRDYSGHIIHQERVRGVLSAEQTAEIRACATPRSIALKYIAPTALVGRELAFVDGRFANKARVKAAGTYGSLAFASVGLDDAKAAVDSRHTLADTGLAAVLERVERALATEAKLRNPVTVTAADFTFANKVVTRYEIHCDRSHALRDAAKLVLCIDPDTRLPVRLEAYDAPTGGKLDGDLREAVSFVNLSFNKGLGDSAFEK